MESPDKKAKEIISKIIKEQYLDNNAKQICISTTNIANYLIDEIIALTQNEISGDKSVELFTYWNQVKKEIENYN